MSKGYYRVYPDGTVEFVHQGDIYQPAESLSEVAQIVKDVHEIA